MDVLELLDVLALDEISSDSDPLDGAVMEKLVHSRLVGGDGVLFVPIGANVGLLECWQMTSLDLS